MHGFLTLFLSFLLSSLAVAQTGPDWRGPWNGLSQLVPLLDTIPDGRRLLTEARKKDPKFAEHIHMGEASFTESTFARSYSLLDGKEQIDLRHEITLSRRLSLSDAVVDLAHELVHYTEKEMLDPYRSGFELKQFVERGIEGEGGELAALEKECHIAWEFQKNFADFPQHRLCQPYRGKDNSFDRAHALADYYNLGAWHKKASPELVRELPLISKKAVVFTSSYARKPYPIALAEEFVATKEAACENNRRKYKLIAAQAEGGRGPATGSLVQERRRLRNYERLYCSPVASASVSPVLSAPSVNK